MTFVASKGSASPLECRILPGSDQTIVIAEDLYEAGDSAEVQLTQLNNELAVLARENARRGKQLQASLHDLENSHWRLKKIQELLPICMECGKVKTDTGWEELLHYLRSNAPFLSHGYCPDCARVLMGRWEVSPGE
jgi:hypothetical protein